MEHSQEYRYAHDFSYQHREYWKEILVESRSESDTYDTPVYVRRGEKWVLLSDVAALDAVLSDVAAVDAMQPPLDTAGWVEKDLVCPAPVPDAWDIVCGACGTFVQEGQEPMVCPKCMGLNFTATKRGIGL